MVSIASINLPMTA